MQTLTINIPEGFRVKSFDEKTGEVSFEPVPKDIKERIKTFKDVLKAMDMTLEDFEETSKELMPDELAYRKLKQIVSVLNEGWTPDWSNSNQPKYVPYFNMGSPSGSGFSYCDYDFWLTNSDVGSRLCSESRKATKHIAEICHEDYKAMKVYDRQVK